MKVLIADKFPEPYIEMLKKDGAEVLYCPDLTATDLKNHIAGIEVLVVRSTEVIKETIETADRLKLIIRAGSGVNTIDVESATKRKIFVANCPGQNSIAVAELAFGLILAIDRKIPDNVLDLRNHKWNKKEYSKADGVFGKTIGIVGVGAIGKLVLERAKAFGLKAIGLDPILTKAEAKKLGIGYCQTIEEVFENADIITLHLPLLPETKKIINAALISKLKPGAILVNTSRGGIIDREALLAAVKEKRIRVGLDVFDPEPKTGTGEFSDELLDQPNFYGTHHIGASTTQSQNAIAEETLRIISNFDKTGNVLNGVNRF